MIPDDKLLAKARELIEELDFQGYTKSEIAYLSTCLESFALYGALEDVPLNTEMNVVGWAGFKEEGRDVYLYQCPKCKTVVFDASASVPFCECKRRRR